MANNWYREQLREQDIRWTDGRELVLSVLADHQNSHLTVEEIYMQAHQANTSIGMASVYRTVDLLVKHGIAQKFEFGEGKARYEFVAKSGKSGHHHHLVCKICKKIINYDDFPEEEKAFLNKIEKGLSVGYNFAVEDHMIQFYGYCKRCKGA